ncbi:MAG: hypothetical protein JNK00_02565 [Flavipsychrobacter sp.]|nr:hypothetical protein [Flavipsychrobacter sp.]
MKFKLAILSVFLFLLNYGNAAFGQDDYVRQGYVKQSRLPRSLQKFQFGLSSYGSNGYYKGYFRSRPDGLYRSIYYEGPAVSKGGLGVVLGTYSRVAKLGKRAAITWDLDFAYNVAYWKGIGAGFYKEREWNNGGVTSQMSLPTGFSLKIGSDARLEKNHRFCLNFGAGINPMFNTTKLEDTVDKPIKQRRFGYAPYLRFEAGVFAGICWKLRVNYAIGEFRLLEDYQNWHKPNPFGVEKFELKGNSGLTVSLILMPFSFDWPDNGWWNNSRTSTKMWKGWKSRNKID